MPPEEPPEISSTSLLAEIQRHAPDVIAKLNRAQKERLAKATQLTLFQSITHLKASVSAFPEASELLEYNQVMTDGAERVLSLVERQQAHRLRLEDKAVMSQLSQSSRGQWMGFGITVLLIASGVFAVAFEQPSVAGIIFGATIIGVGAIFVSGKRSMNRDLNRKNQSISE